VSPGSLRSVELFARLPLPSCPSSGVLHRRNATRVRSTSNVATRPCKSGPPATQSLWIGSTVFNEPFELDRSTDLSSPRSLTDGIGSESLRSFVSGQHIPHARCPWSFPSPSRPDLNQIQDSRSYPSYRSGIAARPPSGRRSRAGQVWRAGDSGGYDPGWDRELVRSVPAGILFTRSHRHPPSPSLSLGLEAVVSSAATSPRPRLTHPKKE
jgi:hypothetical protein